MPPRKLNPSGDKSSYNDFIQPFLIDHSSIRGRLVRVGKVLDDILAAHHYPLAVSQHLAEQIVLTALLSATLTGDDILTVQAKGDGAVRFIVVDAMGGGAVRGYAEVEEKKLKKALGESETGTLPSVMGKGYLAVTLDSGGPEKQRYQGIVELTGDTLSEALQGYFRQSQQAEMQVHVVVKPPSGKKIKGWRGGGIIIERMPMEGGKSSELSPEEQDDLWIRIGLFMRSLKDAEILDTDVTPQNLLYRLFNEDGVWVYKLQPLKSGCRCSRSRMRMVLKCIPEEELLSSLDNGKMTIHCQFCNKREIFTEAQVKQLYKKRAPKKRK